MNSLLELDRWLLLKINQDWTLPFLDIFFPALTDFNKSPYFILVFMPAVLIMVLWKMKKEGMILIATLFLSLAVSDFICGKMLKPWIGRIRPSFDGVEVVLRTPIFGQLGFPSNHAANIFCAATVLSSYFPKGKFVFFAIALLVAYSRSYVGVHYPADWIAGGLVGTAIALIGLKAKDSLLKRYGQGLSL